MKSDLSRAAIDAALRGRLGRPFRVHDSTGSTNADALEWAAAGAPEGALVVADHQTEGRGRAGRTWVSRPGSALQFSLVLRPRLAPRSLGRLTIALGLACAEGVERAAGIPASLKWPNDVTVEGRKLAGILVEVRSLAGRVEVAIAGIGINVDWDEADLPAEVRGAATSVSIEWRRRGHAGRISRADVLAAVLEALEARLEQLDDPAAAERVIESAADRSEVLGRRVTVRLGDGVRLEGVATRLLPSGALELESGGERRALDVGEIEQLRAAP